MVINTMVNMLMVLDKAKENTYLTTAINMMVILKIIKNMESVNLPTKIKDNIMVLTYFMNRTMGKWNETWLRNI